MFLPETIFLLYIAFWAPQLSLELIKPFLTSPTWQGSPLMVILAGNLLGMAVTFSGLHCSLWHHLPNPLSFLPPWPGSDLHQWLPWCCLYSSPASAEPLPSASLAFPLVSIAPILINLASVTVFPLHTHQVFSQDFQSSSSVFPTFPLKTGHPRGLFCFFWFLITCSDFMSKSLSSSLSSLAYKLPLALLLLENFSRTLILCQFWMRSFPS